MLKIKHKLMFSNLLLIFFSIFIIIFVNKMSDDKIIEYSTMLASKITKYVVTKAYEPEIFDMNDNLYEIIQGEDGEIKTIIYDTMKVNKLLSSINENVYDMTYDLEALVGPYSDRIGDDAVYLYDSTDPKEVELLSFLKARLPGIEGVPYESEIGRSDYGVYGNRVGDGLIISTSLDETIGFIRSLESPRIAVTYLDAAALETIKPVLVFSPDWDEIIRGNL